MSHNLTSFIYLKTLKKIENTGYELAHTLFHLQRFLFLNEDIKWERVFHLKNKGTAFEDWGGSLTIRLLGHHNFLQPTDSKCGYLLNAKGLEYLQHLETELSDLNQVIETFFESYKGETVYTNSCMAKTGRKFVACHLCDKPICIQEDASLASSLKTASKLLFKSPYRSYSSAITN